jgi:hypothetical protein
MKKRLVATLCSAVLALSSLTSITAQAVQYGGWAGNYEVLDDTASTSTDTTSTDTSTTSTDTLTAVAWDGYKDVRIYDNFSGTLLSEYAGQYTSVNTSFNFTVTKSSLPVVDDGYTVVKVTSKRVSNEKLDAFNIFSGNILHPYAVGESYATYHAIYDSFGNKASKSWYSSSCGTNSGINSWNAVKCLLEPYGYTYEYIHALASQTYKEYAKYSEDSSDFYMNKREIDIITSALANIYNNGNSYSYSSINAYCTALGNYVYEVILDEYNRIYVLPNSEKIYLAFNYTTSNATYQASTDTLYCVALN